MSSGGAGMAGTPPHPRSWILVAESPFLPADGGTEQEHLGMALALARGERLAAVVIPSSSPVDVAAYRARLGEVPVITVPRSTRPTRLLHPVTPFVVASRPAPRHLVATLARLVPHADAVLVGAYKVHGLGRAVAEGLGLPAVVRMHNIESDYHASLARAATGLRHFVLAVEARRVARDESRLGRAGWVSGFADISSADADRRRHYAERPVVDVPPFLPDPVGTAAPPRHPVAGRVVFLGALDVATNHDALTWFITRIWPLVLADVPTATLQVVGRRPTPGVTELVSGSPRTSLLPDVPHVAPILAAGAVAINPVVSGSGVNIKLVDYLRAGVPTVSTPRGAAGLALVDGADLCIASEATAFAAGVCRMLLDAVTAETVAASGRQRLRSLTGAEAGVRALESLLCAGW